MFCRGDFALLAGPLGQSEQRSGNAAQPVSRTMGTPSEVTINLKVKHNDMTNMPADYRGIECPLSEFLLIDGLANLIGSFESA
jgi:hypothetical protein